MENQDKHQDTELFRGNLKEKILVPLYTRSIKEAGMIPGFKWDHKAKQ